MHISIHTHASPSVQARILGSMVLETCIDTYIDTCIDTQMIDICVNMLIDMWMDMWIDMCIDKCRCGYGQCFDAITT